MSMQAPGLLILQWILRTFIRTNFNNVLSTSLLEPTNFYHLLYSGLILQNFLPRKWWIQQTSSVGERDFLPKHWGCFKFSSFTELVQRLITCWLLFRPFDIFEGQVGLFLCGRTPCAITTPDMSIWNVSRVLTLYQTSPFLACITAFCFPNFLGVQVRQ